jgi:2'-hydroxyisoflavone reductase
MPSPTIASVAAQVTGSSLSRLAGDAKSGPRAGIIGTVRRMKILVLGGTRFLGRAFVEQALAAGHVVTLLHRGRSGPDVFPHAEHRLFDRNGDVEEALGGGSWDVAVDTSAYVPRQVRSVAAALQRRVGQYQLVSSISVYAEPIARGSDESAPVQTLADAGTEEVTAQTYGALKALCEQAAQQAFADRCLVVRPGLIVGPHDPTGRFSWWAQRMERGGEVLAPGDPATPVQFIDVRDLAAWMLLQAERGTAGVFNLNGPAQAATLGDLLNAARDALNPDASLTWVDERFVLDQGVAPWSDLPVWLPQAQAAMHTLSIAAALGSGLRTRPMAETLRDTAAWLHRANGKAVGLAAEKEAAVLAAWKAR